MALPSWKWIFTALLPLGKDLVCLYPTLWKVIGSCKAFNVSKVGSCFRSWFKRGLPYSSAEAESTIIVFVPSFFPTLFCLGISSWKGSSFLPISGIQFLTIYPTNDHCYYLYGSNWAIMLLRLYFMLVTVLPFSTSRNGLVTPGQPTRGGHFWVLSIQKLYAQSLHDIHSVCSCS